MSCIRPKFVHCLQGLGRKETSSFLTQRETLSMHLLKVLLRHDACGIAYIAAWKILPMNASLKVQLCICLRPILYIDPVRDWEGLIYNYNYIRVCVCRYIPIAVIFYFIDAIFKRCGFTNFTRSTDATRDVSSVLAWVGIIKWSIKNRKTVKIISDMEI